MKTFGTVCRTSKYLLEFQTRQKSNFRKKQPRKEKEVLEVPEINKYKMTTPKLREFKLRFAMLEALTSYPSTNETAILS